MEKEIKVDQWVVYAGPRPNGGLQIDFIMFS